MPSLELRVPPVIVVIIVSAAMFGVAGSAPAFFVQVPARLVWCIVLIAAGVTVTTAGVTAFRTQRTTVNPHRPQAASSVVRTGVYRYSRNPMYLGFLLLLSAVAVYLSNALAVLGVPAFVLYMDRFQITPEERVLAGKFGEEYAMYLAQVRRWI
jgi:protein-S-isoprenylcysteine O-methyltransferase Ste14